MKIYLIEDEQYGVLGAFLHESAAEDALNNDIDGFYSPCGMPSSIIELEVYTPKRLFEYRKATFGGKINIERCSH